MQAVRKAIIPAAGLGTRMLPISRCVPKEIFPIVDRPAISYLVNEAIDSGMTEVLIITARDKDAIEDYFDYSPEYDAALKNKGKEKEVEIIHGEINRGNIYFTRQKEKKGLGHAILCAKSFVGNEPFAILYGDDVIFSETPVCKQMAETYEKYGKPVVGLKRVHPSQYHMFSSMKADPVEGSEREFYVTDMIEKPAPGKELSDLAILGRVLLTPDIFDILEETKPGAGGEIQLTDAMAVYARKYGMMGLEYEGKRFDLGSKLGFLEANLHIGAKHEEIGAEFREMVKEFAKGL